MNFSKARSILIITILLFGGVIFSSVLRPAHAQTAQPTVTPNPTTPIPSDELDKLNDEIADLNDKIDDLEDKVRPFSNWLDVLALVGLASPFVIAKLAYDYHKNALKDAFYKADPRNFPVYVPDKNFETERKSLENLGLKKVRKYKSFDGIEGRGVVVVHIPGENFEQDENSRNLLLQTIEDLQSFMDEKKDDHLAFVIYINGQPKELKALLKKDNVAASNMPVTIASHIYTLARGLMD